MRPLALDQPQQGRTGSGRPPQLQQHAQHPHPPPPPPPRRQSLLQQPHYHDNPREEEEEEEEERPPYDPFQDTQWASSNGNSPAGYSGYNTPAGIPPRSANLGMLSVDDLEKDLDHDPEKTPVTTFVSGRGTVRRQSVLHSINNNGHHPHVANAAAVEGTSHLETTNSTTTTVDSSSSGGTTVVNPSDSESAGEPESHHDKPDPYSPSRPKLPIRPRLAHFTWAWYTLCMSTGGIALLIHAQPHQFPGLRQIGLAVYILNIVIFVLLTAAMLTRFFLFPGTFASSITHPREGFFFGTFFLSVATLLTGTQRYVVPPPPIQTPEGVMPIAQESASLLWFMQIAFWAYVVLTTLVAVGQYSYVFSAHSFGLQTMMPTWILPIFPIMLSGTIAAVIAGAQPAHLAVPIITAGLTCQGLGVAVALMMYAHMVGRLMQSGLPHREHRPGLFMCVGPPAFTVLAFMGMAQDLPKNFDADSDGVVLDAAIIRTLAVVSAGFLWAVSFWWFCIAVIAVVQSPPKYFHLGWWACVFPNVGFALATISLGTAFKNEIVLWIASVVSLLLVGTYGFVLFHHVKAVVCQDIMYPGRDEDVEDH